MSQGARGAGPTVARVLRRQVEDLERLRAGCRLGPREALVLASYPALLVVAQFALGDSRLLFAFVRASERHHLPRGLRALLVRLPPWWHDLTRVTHALVHDPSTFHLHLWTNVVGIGMFAAAMYVVCDAAGWRHVFYFGYLSLAATAPVVASFTYGAFGVGALAWGASTVAYGYLGFLAAALVARLRRLDDDVERWWAFVPVALSLLPATFGLPGEALLDAAALLVVVVALGDVSAWMRSRSFAGRRGDALLATLGFLAALVCLPAFDAAVVGNVAHQTGFIFGATLGGVVLTFVDDTAVSRSEATLRRDAARRS